MGRSQPLIRDPMQEAWVVAHLPALPDGAVPPSPETVARALSEIASRHALTIGFGGDAYDEGFCSFVEARLWRDAPEEFRGPTAGTTRCLTVLVSTFAPYAVLAETWWWRNASGSGALLPAWEHVDTFAAPAVAALAELLAPELGALGLVRLSKTDVSTPLPDGLSFPTILNVGAQRLFDALFYWFD